MHGPTGVLRWAGAAIRVGVGFADGFANSARVRGFAHLSFASPRDCRIHSAQKLVQLEKSATGRYLHPGLSNPPHLLTQSNRVISSRNIGSFPQNRSPESVLIQVHPVAPFRTVCQHLRRVLNKWIRTITVLNTLCWGWRWRWGSGWRTLAFHLCYSVANTFSTGNCTTGDICGGFKSTSGAYEPATFATTIECFDLLFEYIEIITVFDSWNCSATIASSGTFRTFSKRICRTRDKTSTYNRWIQDRQKGPD